MYTCEPLRRYSPAISARRPKSATRCHSVRSCCSPVCLSRQLSLVATRRLATVVPDGIARVSGSAPRLPMRMTLLMPRAMVGTLVEQARHSRGGGTGREPRFSTAVLQKSPPPGVREFASLRQEPAGSATLFRARSRHLRAAGGSHDSYAVRARDCATPQVR